MLKIGGVYKVLKPIRVYFGLPEPIEGVDLEKGNIITFLKNGGQGRTHQHFFLYDNKIIYTYFYGEEHQYLNFLC